MCDKIRFGIAEEVDTGLEALRYSSSCCLGHHDKRKEGIYGFIELGGDPHPPLTGQGLACRWWCALHVCPTFPAKILTNLSAFFDGSHIVSLGVLWDVFIGPRRSGFTRYNIPAQ